LVRRGGFRLRLAITPPPAEGKELGREENLLSVVGRLAGDGQEQFRLVRRPT
jgi:hypothetical protein